MISLEPHTVGDSIRIYKPNGLTALEMQYSTAAPRKSNKEQETFLFKKVTNRTPNKFGFESRKSIYNLLN